MRAPLEADRLQFEGSLEYFYGLGVGRHLPWKKIKYIRSRKSQRLKRVLVGDLPLATIREDGSIAYTLECAKYLLKSRQFRKSCIVVNDDAAEFVVKGKSLFAKHVIKVGSNVKVGLDVCLLNEKGKLLAVGKATLPAPYMTTFKAGAAVRVREGLFTRKGKDLNSSEGEAEQD
jgi:uncharacterized protein with predicted RNA binding PUA domain